MSLFDTIRNFLGGRPASPPPLDRTQPDPAPASPARFGNAPAAPGPSPAGDPLPPEMRTPRIPPGPVAVITLEKDRATLSAPGQARSRTEGEYRRPKRVPAGVYAARREGEGIGLYRSGVRISGISPTGRTDNDDILLQYLMYQTLMQAIDNGGDPVIRIDDAYGLDRDEDARPDDGPADVDGADSTAGEDDARNALGALGYETVRPQDAPVAAPVPEAPTPVPEPAREAPAAAPAPAEDSWAPSGAYGR